MSYAKALEKLESLPPDERELASGVYVFSVVNGKPHCGCAIGKLLTEEQRAELVKCGANEGNVSRLNRWRLADEYAPLAGMTYEELRTLQRKNDRAVAEDNDVAARKERYRIVIGWLRGAVAAEKRP